MHHAAQLHPVPATHDAWSLTMRNDYVSSLHSALLQEFGVEGTRLFWSRHPLVKDGRALDDLELAEHLGNERARSPVAWVLGLVAALDPFLIEHGVAVPKFEAAIRRYSNHGSFVQGRYLLPWLSPILLPMFRFGDPYNLMLHGAQLVATTLSPGVDFRRIPHAGSATQPRRCASVWLSYAGLLDGSVPRWDFSMHAGIAMLESPNIIGLPAYDSLELICDARFAQSVPWQASCRVVGDRFMLDGAVYGRSMALSTFLSQIGYRLADLRVEDTTVVVIDRDYTCIQRERVVLKAGCAYGAPGFLARFHWGTARPRLTNFLRFMHADDLDDVQQELDQLHGRYLRAVKRVLRVEYFAKDDSISVDGRHVCRGVGALLLSECVQITCQEQRNEFSFREFKRSPRFVSHPKNTGFETRLNRLRQALDRADCGIRITVTGRGKFVLETRSRLEFIG